MKASENNADNQEKVRSWLREGQRQKAAMMVVFADTTGSSQRNWMAYPIYLKRCEDLEQETKDFATTRQYRMAYYDLSADLEEQMEKQQDWMKDITDFGMD